MFRLPTTAALNHLLHQNEWAIKRLAQHAGKTAQFKIPPFSFSYTIQPDGRLSAASEAAVADATCILPATLLPRLAAGDESVLGDVERAGDAALLAEVLYLSRHLRWDVAEDLSHVVGDIVAERTVQWARHGRQVVRDGALNLTQALAEYWIEEKPLLTKTTQISGFIQKVDKLRDDVARLEQRINRLSKT